MAFITSLAALLVVLGAATVIGKSNGDATEPIPPGGLTLTAISTGFNGLIGIDHHSSTNKVAVSVNYASGIPHNFELVAPDGTHAQFSSVSGLTDEVKIATARDDGFGGSLGGGGFVAGDLFAGTGVPGQIIRISPDGLTVQNPWVTLPEETGLMRGSLYVDRTGIYSGDLIVVTTAGGVWRVNSSGTPTRLASFPSVHLEGVVTVPNDPAKYGPWAGKILAGAEGQGRIYTIDPQGNTDFFELGIIPEDFDLIPANENFYGIDFGAQTIWGAPASAFASVVGDILIAQEFPGILWLVHWNGASFETTNIAQVTQWEHVTFSPAGVVEIPPTPPITCQGQQPTVVGSAGDDILFGTKGSDVIVGLDGDDVIDGLGGNDIICGGPGNDVIDGSEGDDKVWGEAGGDKISGGPGDDLLFGNTGFDTLFGNDGVDRLFGGSGSDSLSGGSGVDDLWGGKGHDSLAGGDGDDYLNGGPQTDTCDGGPGIDVAAAC